MREKMKKNCRRWQAGSLALLLCMLTGGQGVFVQAADNTQSSGQAADYEAPLQTVDSTEISKLVSDTWEEDYFGAIVLDPASGTVEKDGEEEEQIAAPKTKRRSAKNKITSADMLEQYMDTLPEDSLYDVEENEDGEYEITAPFQTKRLIVEENIPDNDCGAEQIYYNEEAGETILQFDTEEETKAAYEALCEIYGKENCYPDEIYYVEDIISSLPAAASGSYSWGADYMGMSTLKSRAPSSGHTAPVTVAVLDTGIDRANFMFRSRYISSQSYNFIDNNKNVADNHGHGTHVAGIIADSTPSNVNILMLKISNSNGYSSLLTIKAALQYALKQNISVINLSVGFVGVRAIECTYLDSLIDKAYRKGIPICAAAGNNAVDVAFCYPACNKKTFAVSAIEPDERLAYYSNRGTSIDFCAPGSRVISAKAGGTLVGMSGTSMSAPHLAAAAAYLKMMQSNLSVQGVYNELKLRCKDLGSSGKDPYFGWGCPVMSDLFDRGIVNKSNIVTNGVQAPVLKSVKNADKGIRITWKKVKGADKYYVYRKKGNGSFKKIKVLSKKNNTYLDKKVKQAKKYTYAVKAVQGKRTSLISKSKTSLWLKPVNKIDAKSKKRSKVVFRWTKQPGVSEYQLRFAGNKKMKKAVTVTASGKSRKKTVTGLKKKTYYYKIRSVRQSGNTKYFSQWSAVKKVRVK